MCMHLTCYKFPANPNGFDSLKSIISSPRDSKVTLSEYLGSAVACSFLLSNIIVAPDVSPTIASPIRNEPVGDFSLINPS